MRKITIGTSLFFLAQIRTANDCQQDWRALAEVGV